MAASGVSGQCFLVDFGIDTYSFLLDCTPVRIGANDVYRIKYEGDGVGRCSLGAFYGFLCPGAASVLSRGLQVSIDLGSTLAGGNVPIN